MEMFATFGMVEMVIFTVMLGITGLFISRVQDSVAGVKLNAIQPQQTGAGRVIDKWTAGCRYPARVSDMDYILHQTDIRLYYFVTVKLQHGGCKEFWVDADAYEWLTVGDSGNMTYQGNWLLQFARHSEEGWHVIESKPQKGRLWGPVFISLFLVVFIMMALIFR